MMIQHAVVPSLTQPRLDAITVPVKSVSIHCAMQCAFSKSCTVLCALSKSLLRYAVCTH